MDRIDWTQLGIKLIALLNLLALISVFPSLLSLLTTLYILIGGASPPETIILWIAVFSGMIIPGILFILLWKYSRQLANKMWPKQISEESTTNPNFHDLQRVLLSAVGLYLAVSRISALFRSITTLIQQRIEPTQFNYMDPIQIAGLIGILFEIVIGLWLFFGTERIRDFLDRIWNLRFET
jgi:hypothetical protein